MQSVPSPADDEAESGKSWREYCDLSVIDQARKVTPKAPVRASREQTSRKHAQHPALVETEFIDDGFELVHASPP
jgi:hypothetical protein